MPRWPRVLSERPVSAEVQGNPAHRSPRIVHDTDPKRPTSFNVPRAGNGSQAHTGSKRASGGVVVRFCTASVTACRRTPGLSEIDIAIATECRLPRQ